MGKYQCMQKNVHLYTIDEAYKQSQKQSLLHRQSETRQASTKEKKPSKIACSGVERVGSDFF